MFSSKTPSETRPQRGLSLFGALLSIAAAGMILAPMAEAKRYYVNIAAANAEGDGSTWAKSFKYLQDALAITKKGDVVWLAKGSYFPDDRKDGLGFGDRELSFNLNGVSLYGGFSGTESALSQRNLTANPTILDGAIWPVDAAKMAEINQDYFGYQADTPVDIRVSDNDEVYWTLCIVKVSADTTLDGLTVQHGMASGYEAPYNQGAGAFVNPGTTLTLKNCVFRKHRAVGGGAAIYGNVKMSDTLIEGNTVVSADYDTDPSQLYGGAIQGDVDAKNCEFLKNEILFFDRIWETTAEVGGGAIQGDLVANNCVFSGNRVQLTISSGSKALLRGGAVSGDVVARDTIFRNSEANVFGNFTASNSQCQVRGGAISGLVTALNCRFTDNSVFGDIAVPDPSYGNTPSLSQFFGGAVEGGISAVNTVFEANRVDLFAMAYPYITPLGVIIINDTFETGGGAMHLLDNSAPHKLTNCVLYGNAISDEITSAPRPGLYYTSIEGSAIRDYGHLVMANCTTVNSSHTSTGDKFISPASGVAIQKQLDTLNSIYWNNGANQIGVTAGDLLTISTKVYFTPSTETRNLIQFADDGTQNAIFSGGGIKKANGAEVRIGNWQGTPTRSGSIINSNPMFVDINNPRGADGVWGTPDDGLRLKASSPASDVSLTMFPPPDLLSNFLPPDILDMDKDGDIKEKIPADFADFGRIQNKYVDLGAYEYGNFRLRPEIDVQQPANNSLVDGSSTVDFQGVTLNTTSKRTFLIRNIGPRKLSNLAVSFTGPDAAAFSTTTKLPDFIDTDKTAKLEILFKPTRNKTYNAVLHIASDDDNENPFDVSLTGLGSNPDITVASDGKTYTDGVGTMVFPDSRLSQYTEKVVMIGNAGNSPLQLGKVSIAGGDAARFSIISLSSTTVAPGATEELTLRFTPKTTGLKKSTLRIASNDPDEDPFDLALEAAGVVKPEITVFQPVKKELDDGGARSFGVVRMGATYTKTFTIKNQGDGILRDLAVSVSGSKRFSVTAVGTTTLNPEQSTTFRLEFRPTNTAVQNAVVKIASNDEDEAIFNIKVDGQGADEGTPVALAGTSSSAAKKALLSEVKVDGKKYLTLTIQKSTVKNPLVEVTGDRVSWFSGKKFTTVLKNNAQILKVRDNTPLSKGKRSIRVREGKR